MRILLNPAPAEGGNGAPEAAAPQTPAPPAMPPPLHAEAPPATKPAGAAPIHVTPDDWAGTQKELQALRDFKRSQDKVLEKAENERLRALAEKGQLDAALEQLHANHEKQLNEYAAQAKQIETQWLGEKTVRAIDEVLAGRAFTGEDPAATAALVRSLLEREVEAVRDAKGNPVIRDRTTLRPANEYLKERLDSPAFSIFFRATQKGGAGTDAARPAAASPKPGGDPYDAFAEAFKANREASRAGKFLNH